MVAAHAAYFSDFDRAQAVAREQRVLAERLGDPYLVAVAAMRQGWSAGTTGECRAFADEAVPKLRRCGHLQGIVELTAGMMGGALLDADDEAAVFAADEGLRAAEELGDPMSLAFACGNAGLAALFQSRMDAAERLFGQQIEIFRRERIDGLWDEPATGLACVAAHAGDDERAATFIGFGEAMPALPLTSNDALVRERLVARFVAPSRAALGERAWQRVAAGGGSDDPRRAVPLRARPRDHGRPGYRRVETFPDSPNCSRAPARHPIIGTMKTPAIVDAHEWEAARQQLRLKEKELTRARDTLAGQRRRMPWFAVEKDYRFEGPDGSVSLLDLFDGRRQLLLYRAFYEPGVAGWPEHGCVGCSFMADHVPHLAHVHARDTTLVYASRAPQADIGA